MVRILMAALVVMWLTWPIAGNATEHETPDVATLLEQIRQHHEAALLLTDELQIPLDRIECMPGIMDAIFKNDREVLDQVCAALVHEFLISPSG